MNSDGCAKEARCSKYLAVTRSTQGENWLRSVHLSFGIHVRRDSLLSLEWMLSKFRLQTDELTERGIAFSMLEAQLGILDYSKSSEAGNFDFKWIAPKWLFSFLSCMLVREMNDCCSLLSATQVRQCERERQVALVEPRLLLSFIRSDRNVIA